MKFIKRDALKLAWIRKQIIIPFVDVVIKRKD